VCADELVQPLEIGKTLIVIGIPVFDPSQKFVTLEACDFVNVNVSHILTYIVIQLVDI